MRMTGEEVKRTESIVLQGADTLIELGAIPNRILSMIGNSEPCNFKASTRDMEYIPIIEHPVKDQASEMKPSLINHSVKDSNLTDANR